MFTLGKKKKFKVLCFFLGKLFVVDRTMFKYIMYKKYKYRWKSVS